MSQFNRYTFLGLAALASAVVLAVMLHRRDESRVATPPAPGGHALVEVDCEPDGAGDGAAGKGSPRPKVLTLPHPFHSRWMYDDPGKWFPPDIISEAPPDGIPNPG